MHTEKSSYIERLHFYLNMKKKEIIDTRRAEIQFIYKHVAGRCLTTEENAVETTWNYHCGKYLL